MGSALDGVIVVAKEPGPTSHDVVGLVRRLSGVKRVGHGGTLDPFAAGVLPVFLGHATRLVESGVKFITVNLGGWDTHYNNWAQLKDKLCPPLDAGLSGLFLALEMKGLLDSTVVFVTGEFGRTPKISQRGGRDHYPRAMFCLMAGGGIKVGQVVGESDALGEGPKNKSITPDQAVARLSDAVEGAR